MNRNQPIVILAVLLLFLSLAPAQDASRTGSLKQLITEALNNNPRLKAFKNAWQADRSAVPQAGALPDPLLSLTLMNVPLDNFVFDQEPMSGKQIAFKQMLPFPGKRTLKENMAQKEAESSQAKYDEIKNDLIKKVKQVYYDLYYVDQALNTTQKNYSLLKQFVDIATTKYTVGKGLQQDVLKAQVELSGFTDKLITLRQRRRTVVARLNALLNRPPSQEMAPVSGVVFRPFTFAEDSLTVLVRRNRPLLKAWQAQLEKSRKKIALSQRNYWPDFTLSMAYTQRDVLQNGLGGVDYLSAGISMNLPIYFWRKQRKQVQQSRLLSSRVEESYRDTQNQIDSRLEATLSELRKNKELAELYKEGIVPQAAQSLESALIGYQTDKIDFLTLINNQMTLFKLELEYTRIVSAYYKTIAELEFIVGTPLQTTSN